MAINDSSEYLAFKSLFLPQVICVHTLAYSMHITTNILPNPYLFLSVNPHTKCFLFLAARPRHAHIPIPAPYNPEPSHSGHPTVATNPASILSSCARISRSLLFSILFVTCSFPLVYPFLHQSTLMKFTLTLSNIASASKVFPTSPFMILTWSFSNHIHTFRFLSQPVALSHFLSSMLLTNSCFINQSSKLPLLYPFIHF